MKGKTEIKAGGITVTGAKVGMGVAAFLFLFGLIFLFVVLQDMSPSEMGLTALIGLFFLGFLGACLAMMVFYWRLIKAGGQAKPDSLLEFQHGTDAGPAGEKGDFSERLRKLEALKNDGLITEAEYLQKRQALLKEDW